MQQSDAELLIVIIFILAFFCIWLYAKLKKEKKQREATVRENTKLIADNALLHAEHLKFQLQPHTLRNMIATIHVAAKNLYNGTEALAETLDYILYKDEMQLVSIQDELMFLEMYKSLQTSFMYQIDSIKIDTAEVNKNSRYYTSPCIPHLITAYFVENAFKHGDVNHPSFLTIQLKLSDNVFEMNVVNKIRSEPFASKGGVGLTNMQQRLDLLLSGKYDITHGANEQEYRSRLIINF